MNERTYVDPETGVAYDYETKIAFDLVTARLGDKVEQLERTQRVAVQTFAWALILGFAVLTILSGALLGYLGVSPDIAVLYATVALVVWLVGQPLLVRAYRRRLYALATGD